MGKCSCSYSIIKSKKNKKLHIGNSFVCYCKYNFALWNPGTVNHLCYSSSFLSFSQVNSSCHPMGQNMASYSFIRISKKSVWFCHHLVCDIYNYAMTHCEPQKLMYMLVELLLPICQLASS